MGLDGHAADAGLAPRSRQLLPEIGAFDGAGEGLVGRRRILPEHVLALDGRLARVPGALARVDDGAGLRLDPGEIGAILVVQQYPLGVEAVLRIAVPGMEVELEIERRQRSSRLGQRLGLLAEVVERAAAALGRRLDEDVLASLHGVEGARPDLARLVRTPRRDVPELRNVEDLERARAQAGPDPERRVVVEGQRPRGVLDRGGDGDTPLLIARQAIVGKLDLVPEYPLGVLQRMRDRAGAHVFVEQAHVQHEQLDQRGEPELPRLEDDVAGMQVPQQLGLDVVGTKRTRSPRASTIE